MAPRLPRQGSNSSFTGAGVIPGLGFCFNKFLHSHVLPKPWQAPHRHGAGSSVLGQGRQCGRRAPFPCAPRLPGCGGAAPGCPRAGTQVEAAGTQRVLLYLIYPGIGLKEKKREFNGVKALLPCLHPKLFYLASILANHCCLRNILDHICLLLVPE